LHFLGLKVVKDVGKALFNLRFEGFKQRHQLRSVISAVMLT
jgi:hypothetical protein